MTQSDPSNELTFRSNDDCDLEFSGKDILNSFEVLKSEKPIINSRFFRFLYRLDEIDKYYSKMLQEHTSLTANLILVIWAHFFNRAYATFSILLSCLVGAFRYNEIFVNLGYHPIDFEVSMSERFRFGVVFMLTYGFALLAMVAST